VRKSIKAPTTPPTRGGFTGKIDWLRIDLGDDAKEADHYVDPDQRFRVAMARQ
jgi:hypothetical protein